MEKAMVAKVNCDLKSMSRLKIVPETGPWYVNVYLFIYFLTNIALQPCN